MQGRRTALVEPPNTFVRVIAFSNAFLVSMSLIAMVSNRIIETDTSTAPRLDISGQKILQVPSRTVTLLEFLFWKSVNYLDRHQVLDVPGFVAEILEEYGKDNPKASKQELIVFALVLRSTQPHSRTSCRLGYPRIHPSACASTGTCMFDNVQTLFL